MGHKRKDFCRKKQLGKINDENNEIQDMAEADLTNLTGCQPSCNTDELSIKESPYVKDWPSSDPTMSLKFLYHDGSFLVKEEYLIYDFSNFVADVGGYLGLLVGQSILSIYYLITDWMKKINL